MPVKWWPFKFWVHNTITNKTEAKSKALMGINNTNNYNAKTNSLKDIIIHLYHIWQYYLKYI